MRLRLRNGSHVGTRRVPDGLGDHRAVRGRAQADETPDTPGRDHTSPSMVTHGVPVTHADVVYRYRGTGESITVGARFIGQSTSLHVAAISRVLCSQRF